MVRVTRVPPPSRGRENRGGNYSEERIVQQRNYSKNIPFTDGGSVTTTVFKIRLYNRTELSGKASLFSTRGGVLKDREFLIR